MLSAAAGGSRAAMSEMGELQVCGTGGPLGVGVCKLSDGRSPVQALMLFSVLRVPPAGYGERWCGSPGANQGQALAETDQVSRKTSSQ